MELFDFKTADILPSYLIFDPKTGKIERLTGQKQNENCLEITNDKYKEIRIALLHIDVDLYKPTKTCLEYFYPHIVKGGIIILDDYGAFPGANKAVEEFFADKNYRVEQLNFSNSISS